MLFFCSESVLWATKLDQTFSWHGANFSFKRKLDLVKLVVLMPVLSIMTSIYDGICILQVFGYKHKQFYN